MSDDQFFKQKEETNIFEQQVRRYLPFWPVFLVTISISLLVAFIYLRSETPIFVAQAKVLLKDPQKGSGDSKVLDALNIFSDKKIVENEIIRLKSSSLVGEVVKKLHLYATVYNEGKVRTEELYKDNSPIWFRAVDSATSGDFGKYFFKVDWQRRTVRIADRIVPFDSTIKIGTCIYRLIPNPGYNQFVLGKNYFVVFSSVGSVTGALTGALGVSASSSTSTVLDVRMETEVPQKGIEILDSLFQVYILANIIDKTQAAKKTLTFIDERMRDVNRQLDSVDEKIMNYKAKNSIYNLNVQSGNYLNDISNYDKKNNELDLELSMLNEVRNYVLFKGKKPGTVPALLTINDPTLPGLLQKLYENEFNLDKVKAIGGEKSDAVILAEADVNRIKKDILENLSNIRSSLLLAKADANSNLSTSTTLLSAIPEKEKNLQDISRSQAIKNNIYTFLLTKREETAMSSAAETTDLQVLQDAYSYGPIRPVPRTFYLTGLAIGLMAAIMFVLVKEKFNNKVMFRTDIEAKTSVPVVAEIILGKSNDILAITEGKRTIIAEQFRSLRTNLAFMGLNEEKKTLLVCSSISGEGKSFIAINLAMSITLTGKKVALLELDLRKPKLSKQLGVNRDPGISNYLIGKAPIENICKETAYPNLFIISAGPIPPNPTELIGSDKFGQMMEELKKRYDYLIIDSAPIGPVTDSLLLNKYADTTVFVVRHAYTPKAFLPMIEGLKTSGKFNNMCIVFNGLKRRGIAYTGSYGYGYGYGNYGYGGDGYYVSELKKRKGILGKIDRMFSK